MPREDPSDRKAAPEDLHLGNVSPARRDRRARAGGACRRCDAEAAPPEHAVSMPPQGPWRGEQEGAEQWSTAPGPEEHTQREAHPGR